MGAFQANEVYVFAAARGSSQAQSDLAIGCRNHAVSLAGEDPDLANEFLVAAEVFAHLACADDTAHSHAVLAAIKADRAIYFATSDPVRSLEYRDDAEQLFNLVEDADDDHALGIIALALNKLADADPEDDQASTRLNSIVEALPPGEAQVVRAIAAKRSQPLGETIQ